ncbi:MAG: hypothetical protein VYA53_01330, partial [Acidobacteriota bacterium]|nr:hypothetical protein [Acidobacteriota bacterium]
STAESAQNTAESAQNTAESAQNTAESAQNTAESAQNTNVSDLRVRLSRLEGRIDALEKHLLKSVSEQNSVQTSTTQDLKDSRDAWRSLEKGMSTSRVRSILGEPDRIRVTLLEYWEYFVGTPIGYPGTVRFRKGFVTSWAEPRHLP